MNCEPSSAVSFTEKIAARSLRCGVIGLGYVGLPLLVRLAEAGFEATGYDVQSDRISLLRDGRSYIGDIADGQLAPHVNSGLLTATDDPDVIPSFDTINICVPTPLSKSREPDMAYVVAVLDTVSASEQVRTPMRGKHAQYTHPAHIPARA